MTKDRRGPGGAIHRAVIAAALAGLALVLCLLSVAVAHAATYTVTNTSDSGSGSLRQAILDANDDTNLDTISFNIGSGSQTIQPGSALPTITGPVTIDGTTQPGYAGTPIIVLDGSSAGDDVDGLVLETDDSTIRGLVIHGFDGNGIVIQEGARNTIAGNYIGTDVTGTAVVPNQGAGVLISNASDNTIGGTLAEPNTIAYNVGDGVCVLSGTCNQILSNSIFDNDELRAVIHSPPDQH